MSKTDIPFTVHIPDGKGNVKTIDMTHYGSSRQSTQTSNSTKPLPRQSQRKTLTSLLHTPGATSRSQRTSHKQPFSQEKQSTAWKRKAIGIGAGLLLGGLVLYQGGKALFDSERNNDAQSLLLEEVLPEGKVAVARHDGDIYYFTAKDSLMRDLSAKQAYVDMDKRTVDKKTLEQTLSLVDQLSFTQLMQTTGLNGMYKIYTDFDGAEINFDSAQRAMWLQKVLKMNGRFLPLATTWFSEYDAKTTPKSDLLAFKADIKEDLTAMLASFDKDKFYRVGDSTFVSTKDGWKQLEAHSEYQRFFNNYLSHLNENILVSYAVTELFPDINPGFNIASFDKLLQEAGTEFVYKIPALFDPYLSFGAFQLTSKIITPEGAPSLNHYFPEEFQIPASMKDIDTPEEHNRAAIMTILYNANILANRLFSAGEITNFNNNFEQLSDKEQELFIAGQASAAHHYSTRSASAVRNYQQAVTRGEKDFSNIVTDVSYPDRLDTYHMQSVRNYLVLDAMEDAGFFTKKKRKK
jgi:hypothetical protein